MRKKSEKNIKTAVITGGSSGIGKQLIYEFLGYGYKVICVSRTDPQIENCDFFECDLSVPRSAETVAKSIAEKYGHIDTVINNAGLGISGATELLPIDKVRYVMEVDYFAPLIFTRNLLPAMEKGGKIVMISSACALFALPYRGVYCSAKSAVSMLSYGLRMELKNTGIDVVCICPGDIKSEFTANRLKYADTNCRYGDSVAAAQNKVDGRENKRMNVVKASGKIAKIAHKKKGALYIVGAKYKLLRFFSRFVSQNFLLKITEKMFNPK